MIVKKLDLLFTGFFGFLAYVLLTADAGLSYDYRHYVDYIIEVKGLTSDNLLDRRVGPYVVLQQGNSIEVGFAFLLKMIVSLLGTVEATYTAIALTSLAIKALICRQLNVHWFVACLLLLYSTILLEANAIRSGLSLSFFMLYLYWSGKKDSRFIAVVSAIFAILTHLQALFFIVVFMALKSFRVDKQQPIILALCFIAMLLVGLLVSDFISLLFNEKIAIYGETHSESGGFNMVSVLSLLLVISAYAPFVMDSEYRREKAVKILILSSCIPSLSIYIFLTEISVLGDRLWQWGLIIFVAFGYEMFPRIHLNTGLTALLRCTPKLFLVLTLCVGLVNIIVRYPLTNIFYPLLPYINLQM